eukprot:gnl/TRDRNA2_/TRDRNA2_134988_c0_seq1.p1 gnl/TRDRNA2_/TRDRNA2_134988_c0~~gnl/TRDRNA2_/TRDRNA2_134988_c0_seq1.p1  ORF type:complete len:493 (+),score=110.27 gnl/TRDRNA2_/TRDRNA2_134988_c0_seq1:52-1479(+)
MVRTAAWAAYLLALASRATAQIRVMSPQWLLEQFATTKGKIDGSTATFGAPYYGDRLLGRLVWGDSLHNHTHCMEDDYEVPPPDEEVHGQYKEVRLIHIVMVRRGGCSFVTKVRVARKKGAHAVIIVDSEASQYTSDDIQRIIVADDGYGENIQVPSILISKQEGYHLIDAVKKTQVIIELAWDVPTHHTVVMDLWMSSASRESMRFLTDFAAKRRALNDAVKFVPHYHVFGMQESMDYNDLCTDYTAQFCAEDPDGSGPVTGKEVLEEDVRQLCIHDLYKVAMTEASQVMKGRILVEYSKEYWAYVERLLEFCPLDAKEPSKRFGKECSHRLMEKVGIDVSKVEACFRGTKDDKLRSEKENIAWSPRALRINGWRYSGTLDSDLVTRALCAGFVKKPDACNNLVQPRNPFIEEHIEQGFSFGSFVLTMVIIAGLGLCALLIYKRSLTSHIHKTLREEVMLEVQAQMGTYQQMAQ